MVLFSFYWLAALSFLLHLYGDRLAADAYSGYRKVKLLLGHSWRDGIVAVEYRPGNWSVVCADGFSHFDAGVVCRQLGYPSATSLCCNPYIFPEPDKAPPLAMANIRCRGDENQLANCPHSDVSRREEVCRNKDGTPNYASVVCGYGSRPPLFYSRVSIARGGKTGALHVQFDGLGARICADGWKNTAAHVACREIGYAGGVAYAQPRINSPWSDEHNGRPLWTTNVTCRGYERSLASCRRPDFNDVKECRSNAYAAVACYHAKDPAFRLYNPSPDDAVTEGAVEVYFNRAFYPLCLDGWGEEDINVMCRQFGYPRGYANTFTTKGRAQQSYVTFTPRCSGDERSVIDCPGWDWDVPRSSSCQLPDEGVTCRVDAYFDEPPTESSRSKGIVVMRAGPTSHYAVCADGFDLAAATVLCRVVGYDAGEPMGPYGPNALESVYLSIGVAKLKCTGREIGLTMCNYSTDPADVASCGSSNYAVVSCYSGKKARYLFTTPRPKRTTTTTTTTTTSATTTTTPTTTTTTPTTTTTTPATTTTTPATTTTTPTTTTTTLTTTTTTPTTTTTTPTTTTTTPTTTTTTPTTTTTTPTTTTTTTTTKRTTSTTTTTTTPSTTTPTTTTTTTHAGTDHLALSQLQQDPACGLNAKITGGIVGGVLAAIAVVVAVLGSLFIRRRRLSRDQSDKVHFVNDDQIGMSQVTIQPSEMPSARADSYCRF